MSVKALALLACLAWPSIASAACEFIQFTATIGAVKPWTEQFNTPLTYQPPYAPYGYSFPYVVPTGHYLGLTDFHFASKNIIKNGTTRNSYLMLWGAITITEHASSVHTNVPLILPPGFRLDGAVTNASDEPQNMNVWVAGYLSTDPTFSECVKL
jgi:hypothetical protein